MKGAYLDEKEHDFVKMINVEKNIYRTCINKQNNLG